MPDHSLIPSSRGTASDRYYGPVDATRPFTVSQPVATQVRGRQSILRSVVVDLNHRMPRAGSFRRGGEELAFVTEIDLRRATGRARRPVGMMTSVNVERTVLLRTSAIDRLDCVEVMPMPAVSRLGSMSTGEQTPLRPEHMRE